MKTEILKEVMSAYTDCWSNEPFAITEGKRNLNFRASAPVSREEAVAIMRQAVPGGYNKFNAELLAKLPADAQATLAREGSVCIYVKSGSEWKPDQSMRFDECDKEPNGETRLWWD